MFPVSPVREDPVPPVPCYGGGGGAPLSDALTGEDLDCGNVPHRVDCPADSFCHVTAAFAKCCPKSKGLTGRSAARAAWAVGTECLGIDVAISESGVTYV